MLVAALQSQSQWRRGVRQPQTPLPVVQRFQAMREEYPRWGREKLRTLLAQEGVRLSVKSIDRVLHRLKARGVLREAARPRRAPLRRCRGRGGPRNWWWTVPASQCRWTANRYPWAKDW